MKILKEEYVAGTGLVKLTKSDSARGPYCLSITTSHWITTTLTEVQLIRLRDIINGMLKDDNDSTST